MQWKNASSPNPRKFKVQAPAGKIKCTVFWDAEGLLLIDYMPHKVTVTGIYYADLIRKLRWEKLTQVPLLLHDNAPAHRSDVGQAVILECGFEEMRHPPYSPDLAPSDYHLFPNLKEHLRGQRFSTDDELKYATEEWLKGQSELPYFISQALKNSEIATNCALTMVVTVVLCRKINICSSVYLLFKQVGLTTFLPPLVQIQLNIWKH